MTHAEFELGALAPRLDFPNFGKYLNFSNFPKLYHNSIIIAVVATTPRSYPADDLFNPQVRR